MVECSVESDVRSGTVGDNFDSVLVCGWSVDSHDESGSPEWLEWSGRSECDCVVTEVSCDFVP